MTRKRKLPLLTPETKAFWQGGREGRLEIFRCKNCRRWLHPPGPICPNCGSVDVDAEPASGRGRICSFTINLHRWSPDLDVPYVVAIVELVEQDGLRFVTNIVHCRPEDVQIGQAVRVVFQQEDDVWLPLFEIDR